MSALNAVFKVLAGKAPIEDAASIIKGTQVDQPAPTIIKPQGEHTRLEAPAVTSEKAKELPSAQAPIEPAEEIVEQLEPGAPPSKPFEPEPEPVPGDIPDDELQAKADELSGAQYDPDLQGGAAGPHSEQLNFENIVDFDGVKAVEQKIASGIKLDVDEARRGVIANEQMNALADDLGLQRSVIEQVLKREQGDVLNPESILAARKVLQKSAESLKFLADKVARGDATGQDKLRFRQQLMFHQDYYKGFMGARAEAGRALNVFKIPVGSDAPQVNRMLELSESAHGIKIEQAAELINATGNLGEVTQAVDGLAKAKVTDMIYESWVNGILSGVRTQEVNLVSNAMFQVMHVAETGVAAQMSRMRGATDSVQVGEATAMLYGTMQAWQDALKFFARTVRTGVAADDVEKFENVVRRKAIASENFDILQKDNPLAHAVARAVDLIGSTIRIPTERGLTSTDELFKTLATRGQHAALSYREAAIQARRDGLSPEDSAALLTELLRNPTKEIAGQAADKAYEVTFQQALGEGGRAFQKTVATTPGFRWITPFIKTLINVFNESMVKRSPLGLISPKIIDDLKAGGARGDLARARMAMGTLTAMSIAAMVKGGHITGGQSSTNRGYGINKAAGVQPYSLRMVHPITGEVTWKSLQRAEPLSFLIGATADIVETIDYLDLADEVNPDSNDFAFDAVTAVISGLAEHGISKTFMSGVSQFFEMAGDPRRHADNYFKNFASSMVPYVSLRRDVTKVSDPYARQAWTLVDKIKATVPGWSDEVPKTLDVFGEDMGHPSGSWLGAMSIAPELKQSTDPVKQEMKYLMDRTLRTPISKPSRNIEGMGLTSEQYRDYIWLSRKGVTIGGKDFYTYIANTMESKPYIMGSLDERVDYLRAVQTQFDKKARRALEEHNFKFAADIAKYREDKEAKEARQ